MHDPWAPYDTYTQAVHALCNAHALRELVYVMDTPPPGRLQTSPIRRFTRYGSCTGSLAPRTPPPTHPTRPTSPTHLHLLHSAVVLAAEATAERASELERKHHALFVRLRDRREDYLCFVTNPAVPFDNNPAEQTIRMPILRVKVSGCIRTLAGAEHFAVIRSYIATDTRHGINMLDALIQAATGNPWIPPDPTTTSVTTHPQPHTPPLSRARRAPQSLKIAISLAFPRPQAGCTIVG